MSAFSTKQYLNFINKFIVLLFIVSCQLSVVCCFAQEIPPPPVNTIEQKIEDRIETVAETADENADFTELADNLRYFNRHPINLNSTTRDELQQLGLLNDIQIENLFSHIKKNGHLLSFEELQTIDGFDLQT
ncbi:MAG: helix-hairpin-helix domain-containing protein, partial [Bacteroidia bacterium]